jgi:origin recognition complex subunit 1
VDSRRGLYYKLYWHADRKRSFQSARGDDVQWSSGALWVVVAELVRERWTKAPARVEENADTESGAGSDGQYSDESARETSSHADLSDPGSANVNPPDPPQTPSRKRKQTASTASTPRRKRVGSALAVPTPHSKHALRARARRPAMRAPPPKMAGAFSLSEESTEKDPWLRAIHARYVGACPAALPSHTEEYGRVMRAVEELLEEGSGRCICEFVCPLSVINDEVIN